MSTATVLTSAMSGMPVLKGTEGSLAAVIRYIAPILGWEIMFDNGPVIVVRPQSYKDGQPLLYRIDDSAARGGYAPRVAEVRAYESMSDINTGAGLVGPSYIHKSATADTTARPWAIIGDEYGFLLLSQQIQYAWLPASQMHYVGFINSPTDSIIPKCAVIGGRDSTAWGSQLINKGSTTGLFCHISIAGAINTPVSTVSGCGYEGSGEAISSQSLGASCQNYPYYSKAFYSRPFLSDGAVGTISGYIPGLHGWYHKDTWPTEFANMSANPPPSVVNPLPIGEKRFVRFYQPAGSAVVDAIVVFDIGEGFRL